MSEGWAYSPTQDTTEEGGVEALWRGEAALHLRHRHLVLGGGGEEGEAAWHGAEHIVAREHPGHAHALLALEPCKTPQALRGVLFAASQEGREWRSVGEKGGNGEREKGSGEVVLYEGRC